MLINFSKNGGIALPFSFRNFCYEVSSHFNCYFYDNKVPLPSPLAAFKIFCFVFCFKKFTLCA